MTLLTALLSGISVAGLVWLAVYGYQNRRLMANRFSETSGGLEFPYQIYGMPHTGPKKAKDHITLDQIGPDKLAADLYLAGIRSQKSVRFFSFLIRASYVLPVVLMIFYALMGTLNFKTTMGSLAIGVILFVYIRFSILILKQKRQRRLLRALPQFLDLIVVCVEAGLSFISALERVLKEMDLKEPLAQEFSAMYHEYLGGLPLGEACERMGKRCGVSDLSLLLSAIVQSDQMGASLGGNLRTQSFELRDKLRQRIRGRAYQVPVKILTPLILIFLSFMLLNLGYIGYQMGYVIKNKGFKQGQGQYR